MIRAFGVEGLQEHIRRGVRLAQEFAGWVEADPHFDVVAPAPLNLVCFRYRADDAFNEALLDRINRSGKAYLNHTRLDGHLVLRMAIGGTYTEARHVRATWDVIRQTADALAGEG